MHAHGREKERKAMSRRTAIVHHQKSIYVRLIHIGAAPSTLHIENHRLGVKSIQKLTLSRVNAHLGESCQTFACVCHQSVPILLIAKSKRWSCKTYKNSAFNIGCTLIKFLKVLIYFILKIAFFWVVN